MARRVKGKAGYLLSKNSKVKKDAKSIPHVLTPAEIERGRSNAYTYAI